MKIIRLTLSLAITVALTVVLNRSLQVGGMRLPPLGKFLDPFHGFWQNSSKLEAKNLSLQIKGLQKEVNVLYDSVGIPHIFAQNDADLSMVQGYITARDRLWQMEFQTHAAAGRISEILGPGQNNQVLDFDRLQRRLGMVFGAEHAVHAMESESIISETVNNYSKGVNQYINSLSYEDLPLEYKLLDYYPEQWTNIKCALLLKYMAKTLNMGEKDFEMTNARKLFGAEIVDLLYPDREDSGDPVVDKPGAWNFNSQNISAVKNKSDNQLIAIKALEKSPSGIGSNNWAVGGKKTATGSPILCNDPHLTLSLPSIWYAIHLQSPTANVMGVSLPGAPDVTIGFNDSIAWGVTNAQRDLVDWYRIIFADSSKDNYYSGENIKPLTKRIEAHKARGVDIFYDTICFTDFGPIIYDKSFGNDGEQSYYAFRWVAHDESNEAMTFHMLNRAQNHDDFMKALDYFSGPAQNFIYASVAGDIAVRVQGKFPLGPKEEGKFVLDSRGNAPRINHWIPFNENVMDKNPERGFVSSANQYPADETYPYYITATNYEAYRNRRINNLLRSMDNINPQDLMKMQSDNFNLKALESLPMLLQMLDSTTLNARESEIVGKLASWDFFNNGDSEAASYYDAWWRSLMSTIWDEMINSKYSLDFPTSFTTIKLIKEKPDFSFFDVLSTPKKETAREVAQLSFREAIKNVEDWKSKTKKEPVWASFKDTFIEHLTRQEAFSVHVETGGSGNSINAITRRNGPSWRMVVSLEKTGVKAWGVYPGGQSGNPGSPLFDNMIPAWTAGKHFSLAFPNDASDPSINSLYRITLTP